MGALYESCCKSKSSGEEKPKLSDEDMDDALKKINEMLHGK